jgi:hypothetical protein
LEYKVKERNTKMSTTIKNKTECLSRNGNDELPPSNSSNNDDDLDE